MSKPKCKPNAELCCANALYWRELSHADHARAELLSAERDELLWRVDRLRQSLRECESEIARMVKRKKPVASEYGYRELRRRA